MNRGQERQIGKGKGCTGGLRERGSEQRAGKTDWEGKRVHGWTEGVNRGREKTDWEGKRVHGWTEGEREGTEGGKDRLGREKGARVD